MNSLLSIIVPVYNVESYIKRCLDSLLQQDYESTEIIVIDDGSTDSSGRICKEYARKYENVKYYYKENGGLSSARNCGMDKASGTLITFIDSDDWVHPQIYSKAIRLFLENHCDLVEFGISVTHSDIPFEFNYDNDGSYILLDSRKTILRDYLLRTTKKGGYSVCNCIFNKSIIKDLRFREGRINEDIDFKFKALANCNRYIRTNLIGYYYYQRLGSTSMGVLRKRDLQIDEAADELIRLCKIQNDKYIVKLAKVKKARGPLAILNRIAYAGFSPEFSALEQSKLIHDMRKRIKNDLVLLLLSPIQFSRKVAILTVAISFPLFCRISSKFRK